MKVKMKKTFCYTILLKLAFLISVSVWATNSIAQSIWQNNPSKLACSPHVLHPKGTLKLTLGSMHGSELAIKRKGDGITFFLVVGNPPSYMVPLMTTSEFSKTKELKLSANIEAFPWVNDSKKESVFTKSGDYTIQISNNLESEEGGYYCNIKYLSK